MKVGTALRVWMVLLLLLLLFAVSVVAVAAQGGAKDDSVLIPLLEKLFVPGVLGVVVGVLLSYVIDFFPGYDGLGAKAKRLIFFGICLVISLVAGVLIPLIGGEPLQWDPILGNAIVASLAAMSGGTLAHTRQLSS